MAGHRHITNPLRRRPRGTFVSVAMVPIAAAVLVAPPAASLEPWSTLTEPEALEAVPYAGIWYPVDLNERGQILASESQAGASAAVVWDTDGSVTDVGSIVRAANPLASGVNAVDVNATGQVVGVAGQIRTQAFRVDSDTGTYVDLAASAFATAAWAVDDTGRAVGTSRSTEAGTTQPVVWDPSGAATTLPSDPLGGGALDVSETGLVVGYTGSLEVGTRPVVWDLSASAPADATPRTLSADPRWTQAIAVNDRGQVLVTGFSGPGAAVIDSASGAVLWQSDEAVSPALGEAGQVAGLLPIPNTHDAHAFVTDLATGATWTSPLVTGASRLHLNHRGQLSFSAAVAGTHHAFVWDPVLGLSDLGTAGLPRGLYGPLLGDSGLLAGGTPVGVSDVGTVRLHVGITPSAVRLLRSTVGPASVVLAWQAPATDGNAAIQSYVVTRDGVEVATLPATALGFTDSGVVPSTGSRTYAVRAVNRWGASAAATIEVTAAPSATTTTATTAPAGRAHATTAAPRFTG